MPAGRAIDHIVHTVHDLDDVAGAYEALGFTLTPRAQHPWGTANRLAQFQGHNFIEILEVDRPDLIFDHDPSATPPVFSFGKFNQDYLESREGMAMLVLQGDDAAADVARYQAADLKTYAPFDFERQATLPDGSSVKVAFSLAFASHPDMPLVSCFTCHNRYPENFWRPDFMRHENGATEITGITLATRDNADTCRFLQGFSGGEIATDNSGVVSCGHRLYVEETTGVSAFSAVEISGGAPGRHEIAGLTIEFV